MVLAGLAQCNSIDKTEICTKLAGWRVNHTNRADGRSLLLRSALTFSPTCRYTSTRDVIAASRTCGTQNTLLTKKHNYRLILQSLSHRKFIHFQWEFVTCCLMSESIRFNCCLWMLIFTYAIIHKFGVIFWNVFERSLMHTKADFFHQKHSKNSNIQKCYDN